MKKLFMRLLEKTNSGQDMMLVTIIRHSGSTPRESGAQMLVDESGNMFGTIGGGAVENEACLYAVKLIKDKRSCTHDYILRINSVEDIGMVCGGNVTLHFQYIASDDSSWKELAEEVLKRIEERKRSYLVLNMDGSPACLREGPYACSYDPASQFAISLPIGEHAIIFGAGHCAHALVPVLSMVGFVVTVFDDRPELLNKERYPQAAELICGDYRNITDYLKITQDDYVVIMTSGHTYDYTVEKTILDGEYAYLGVIGSRKKIAVIDQKLREDGVSEDRIASVHTPVGIPIMAQTPEEIAISIAAEMILERARINGSEQKSGTVCPMHTPGA